MTPDKSAPFRSVSSSQTVWDKAMSLFNIVLIPFIKLISFKISDGLLCFLALILESMIGLSLLAFFAYSKIISSTEIYDPESANNQNMIFVKSSLSYLFSIIILVALFFSGVAEQHYFLMFDLILYFSIATSITFWAQHKSNSSALKRLDVTNYINNKPR